tara:strand:- start:1129 stop:1680 length:552 start_codon:yes stop_codon:yes gene_type:complete
MTESEIPGILVAMPSLENTYFEKSIILLCNYNAEGAFGLVMNRPSPTKVHELVSSELKNKEVFNTPILLGGPVEPNSFWSIHSSEISIQDTTKISEKLNLSSAQEILSFLSKGHQISSYQFGIGYSGWGPGQLDREINEESWWLAPLNESVLIDIEYDLRWEKTMENLGFDLLNTTFSQTGMV